MIAPDELKIKIFSDGANPKAIIEGAKNPLIRGFTTNPTLMRQAGIHDYVEFCRTLVSQTDNKPICFEVFADEFGEMKRQAKEIASWGENVYVKIPITNTLGESSIDLIQELSHEGVKLNITAVFTLTQVWNSVQALKGGAPSIISVFAGRIADSGRDPVPIVQAATQMCEHADANIECLWASCREAFSIIQANQAGCHIITVVPDILKKMASFTKPLEEFSLETVQMFRRDAESAGYEL